MLKQYHVLVTVHYITVDFTIATKEVWIIIKSGLPVLDSPDLNLASTI